MYLKVMTSRDAAFYEYGIRGTLSDLTRLAQLIETKLASATPGDRISISDEFATESPYALILDVREESFDPAAADPALNKPTGVQGISAGEPVAESVRRARNRLDCDADSAHE
jgi:hypothetical protein